MRPTAVTHSARPFLAVLAFASLSIACTSPAGDGAGGDGAAREGGNAPAVSRAPVVVVRDVAWGLPPPAGRPNDGKMVPRLLAADRTDERIATVEDEVDLPMRRWLRIRNVADLSVVVTAPLCLAGAPEGRVAVPCDIQAAPGNVRAAAFAPAAGP